ncbi:MAG: nitrilase-related carbon-nitrogen hydrolase, partial [Verrucomicrobiales bacterium]
MKLVRVASGMVNQTPMDWEGNRLNLISAIAEARAAGASVLCLPELAVTGYGCEDAFLSPGVGERAMEELQNLLPETEGMIVAVGLPVWHRSKVYDCAAVLADGQLVGFAAKQFLAGDGLHYEPRWFKPWPNDVADEIQVGSVRVPFGDLIFEFDGVRIGFEICEDAWVATRPGSDLSRRGVDMILSPSASHFAFGKQRIRERFVLEGSRAFGVTYVYTNLVGNESGRVIFDGGAIIASGGERLATGTRLGFRDVE